MLTFYCTPSHATIYYINHLGGTAAQCDGKTNVPYPGSGSGLSCQLLHPYWLLTYTGGWASLVAGDTVMFTDPPTNTTHYPMGEQNAGVGFDWGGTGASGPLGGICPPPNQPYPAGASCILPPLPDNTTWIGQNVGGTANGLTNPTYLDGINGAFDVFILQGTTGVTLEGFAISQPDNCTLSGVGSGGGCSASANYVAEAGIRFQDGTSQGPRNLTMHYVMVAGLAANGILGSHLNTTGTDIVNTDHVFVWGNGNAGYNADGSGSCNTSCQSVGTWNVSHWDVEGNGCLLLKPFSVAGPFLANGFNYCFGQSDGGYGDGFVLISAGTFTVNVDHSFFKYNTQDGFDGLHISDALTAPITNISTSWSEGNAGAAFKFGVGVSVTDTAVNNVGIANCHILGDSAAFPNNPSGWIVLDGGDQCRAAGDQWSFQLSNGSTLVLENNSMAGYGTTMLELGCGALATSCGANGATVVETNDAHIGYPDPGNAGRLASGWNLEAGVPMPTLDHNSWYSMDSGCPDSAISGETNFICNNPLWVGQSNVDALNPNLTSLSPLIGAGITISGITTDYNGTTRPSPPAIGAFEFSGGTPAGGVVYTGNTSISGKVVNQ